MGYQFFRYARYNDATSFLMYGPNGHDALKVDIDATGAITKLHGPSSTGNDLEIYGSQADTYPKIKLNGAGHLNLYIDSASAAKDLLVYDQTTQMLKIDHTANVTNIAGGGVSGDDLELQANTTNSTGKIWLNGNGTIDSAAASGSAHRYYLAGTQYWELSGAGCIFMKESTTPTAKTDWGCIYTKNDNNLYFQDGAGVEHTVAFV